MMFAPCCLHSRPGPQLPGCSHACAVLTRVPRLARLRRRRPAVEASCSGEARLLTPLAAGTADVPVLLAIFYQTPNGVQHVMSGM